MSGIAAVVLAAGASTRLGQPKQLLQFRGETLVRRAVRAASEAGCGRVIVVTGASHLAVADELRGSGAETVRNAQWQLGLGTSIRSGVAHSQAADALLLLTCDQPLVDATLLREMIATRKTTRRAIVAAAYAETVGIPALFDRSCFAELQQLPDGSGAKAIIISQPARVATVCFPGGGVDIDTPADLRHLAS